MTNRKYEVREAGNGFLSKLGTGVIAVGSVAAAVVAVSPQGAVLESLVYNPEAMPTGNLASGASGSAPLAAGQPVTAPAGSAPPTLEDYLVLGDLNRSASSQLTTETVAFVELGSILSGPQSGGSVGNVTNSTQYASTGGDTNSGNQGNVTGSTPTADTGGGGNGNTGDSGNVTSPTPGGGEDSDGEDSYGEDGEDSLDEDSRGEDGEDSHDEDSRGED